MFTANVPLILASASPRRKEFLDQLGLRYSIKPADIDETSLPEERPEVFARRMALSKARALSKEYPQACIIAADTVVSLGRTIFGKPNNPAQALSFLQQLQGRTHQVTTGYSIIFQEQDIEESATETTAVSFGHFPSPALLRYVNTGDPLDKAGGYGIQGIGTFLVHSIEGSYSNVVGLPVNQLLQCLLKHNLVQLT